MSRFRITKLSKYLKIWTLSLFKYSNDQNSNRLVIPKGQFFIQKHKNLLENKLLLYLPIYSHNNNNVC